MFNTSVSSSQNYEHSTAGHWKEKGKEKKRRYFGIEAPLAALRHCWVASNNLTSRFSRPRSSTQRAQAIFISCIHKHHILHLLRADSFKQLPSRQRHLSHSHLILVPWETSFWVSADLRCRLLATDETSMQSLAWCDGTNPFKQLYMVITNLHMIHW